MLLREAPPESASAHAHGFLLAEALGDPADEVLGRLAAGIRSDAPVLDWALELLTPAELRELALRPELADRPIDTPDGARLLSLRCRALLLAGREAEALDLVSSQSFASAAFDDAYLAFVAREVMVATAFSDPDRARSLFDRFGADLAVLRTWMLVLKSLTVGLVFVCARRVAQRRRSLPVPS